MTEEAKLFHLSPNGSDEGDGTIEEPWETLAYAVSQMNSGDELHIAEGTYIATN